MLDRLVLATKIQYVPRLVLHVFFKKIDLSIVLVLEQLLVV
jgi:hypothetical protein